MDITINVGNLGAQKNEILTGIRELSNSADEKNTLLMKIQSLTGSIPDALEIIDAIHTSTVDLVTESSGNNEAAGLLLAAAGMRQFRRAHYATTFLLSSVPPGDGSRKKKDKDPYSSCIVETLVSLGAKKSGLAELVENQPFITAIDAKKMKIIDDAGIVKSKYIEEKKKDESPDAQVAA